MLYSVSSLSMSPVSASLLLPATSSPLYSGSSSVRLNPSPPATLAATTTAQSSSLILTKVTSSGGSWQGSATQFTSLNCN